MKYTPLEELLVHLTLLCFITAVWSTSFIAVIEIGRYFGFPTH
jgi:hypothetical protein|tara:strand:+ start:267 stop:395 length:129 start_codon:yes stop_codon:yes gene_type:complete